jgi:hypothetical protein
MACSHSDACPLFPKLNASLRGWRDAYCDSDSGWRSCARYTQSLTGRSVPLTLLPNGKYAHTMTRADAVASTATTAPTSRFASLPRVAAALPGSPFEEEAPVLVRPQASTSLPPRPPIPPQPTASAPPRRGGSWWARFVKWMRGPV